MKYTLATVFCLSLVVALTGCQSKQKAEADAPKAEAKAQTEYSDTQTPANADDRFLASLRYHDHSPAQVALDDSHDQRATRTERKAAPQKMLTSKDIRSTVNNELSSLAHSREELKNRGWRTMDTNMRALVDDWQRFWLMDRPSRSTIYPVP